MPKHKEYLDCYNLSSVTDVLPAGPETAGHRDEGYIRECAAAPGVICDGALCRGCVLGRPTEQPTRCQVILHIHLRWVTMQELAQSLLNIC